MIAWPDPPGAGTRVYGRWRLRGAIWTAVLAGLVAGGPPASSSFPQSADVHADEPIVPVPQPTANESLKIALGARLFDDPRLSKGDARSCSSCHDIRRNGASTTVTDVGANGAQLPLNTTTVFNAALSFRLGWEGGYRTLEAQAQASLENPRIMGTSMPDVVAKLRDDPAIVRHFWGVYQRAPQPADVLDALASFERSMLTPDSRFDLWLAGDSTALSEQELTGYGFFKSLGCASCHQGVGIGGNLFQRHGIFRPLAAPTPEIVRVPSLRNVAVTPPYFHDGSAPTLKDAVRKMGIAQLNSTLTDEQLDDIVAFLQTLTGRYHGKPVGGAP